MAATLEGSVLVLGMKLAIQLMNTKGRFHLGRLQILQNFLMPQRNMRLDSKI
jgi:hypothetical protein